MTEHRTDGVGFVEDDHATMEIGDGNVVSLDGGRGRHPQPGDDHLDKFTFQAVMDQAPLGLMVAVAD